ncbi:hypothetical protein D3C81_1666320 [compost metagenome]
MGTFQLHGQAPALAALHMRTAIPRQAQVTRQWRTGSADLIQIEAHPIGRNIGQAADPPLQPEGAAIEILRQPVVENPLRRQARPDETKQENAQPGNPAEQQRNSAKSECKQHPERRQTRQQTQCEQPGRQRDHP